RRLFFRRAESDQTKWVMRPTVGLFDQRRREIASATAGFANVLDRRRLISCATEFVCREMVEAGLVTDDGSKRLCAAIGRLSQQGVVRPMDDYLATAMRRKPEYQIPAATTPSGNALEVRFDRTNGVRFELHRLWLEPANKLFLPGTHSWQLWREAAFLTNGKTDHAQERLARLFPPAQTGPVATLALAEAMRLAGMNEPAAEWVRQRAQYATLDGLRRDYADLLSPGCRASDYLLQIAEAMRGLEPADAEALFKHFRSLGWLSKSDQRRALRFHDMLCADPNLPVAAALGSAIDDLWLSRLQRKIDQRLAAIGAAAPDSDRQPQARRRRLLFR
ncbi:MAG: hypothetical protein ACREJM_06395, partial [Candidatus Saccharimonadales bacterium]